MGFQVQRRKAVVRFEEGHEYYGAEIEINLDLPIRMLFDFQELQATDYQKAMELFARDVLAGWNLEEDGEPVPADIEGLGTLPHALVSSLMSRWMAEASAAPTPLEQPSSDTDGSVVPLERTGTQS